MPYSNPRTREALTATLGADGFAAAHRDGQATPFEHTLAAALELAAIIQAATNTTWGRTSTEARRSHVRCPSSVAQQADRSCRLPTSWIESAAYGRGARPGRRP